MKAKRKNQQISIIFRPMLWDTDNYLREAKYSIIVGSIASIVFILGFIGSLYIYFPKFINSPVTVEGVVLGIEETDCLRCISYAFEIFTDTGKEIIHGRGTLDGDVDMPLISDTIMIIYSAKNPSKNILYDAPNPIREAPLVLIGLAVATIWGLYLFFGGFALRRYANQPKIKNDTTSNSES